IVEGKGARREGRLLFPLYPEHIGPLIRKEIGVLRSFKKGIDQPGAFVERPISQERVDFRGIRQRAANIQRNTTYELLVGAQVRRLQAEFLPFLLSEEVHERLLGELICRNVRALWNGGAKRGHLTLVARHDGGFAAQSQRMNQTGWLD